MEFDVVEEQRASGRQTFQAPVEVRRAAVNVTQTGTFMVALHVPRGCVHSCLTPFPVE